MYFPKNPPEGIGQCFNAIYEFRSKNEKSAFLPEDQLWFYAINSFFVKKCPNFAFFSF